MLVKFKSIKVQSKSSPPSIVLLSLQDSACLPLGLPCMVTSSSSAITKMPQLDNTESKLTLTLQKPALPSVSAAAFFLCLLCLLLLFRFSPEFRRKSSQSHTKAIVNIAWIPWPMKNTNWASNHWRAKKKTDAAMDPYRKQISAQPFSTLRSVYLPQSTRFTPRCKPMLVAKHSTRLRSHPYHSAQMAQSHLALGNPAFPSSSWDLDWKFVAFQLFWILPSQIERIHHPRLLWPVSLLDTPDVSLPRHDARSHPRCFRRGELKVNDQSHDWGSYLTRGYAPCRLMSWGWRKGWRFEVQM